MNVGDHISTGSISGEGHRIGSSGNTYNIGATPDQQVSPESQDAYPLRQALYAFADIVTYSQLTTRLQRISQQDLRGLLDTALTQAGVQPEQVVPQDQGDARLLWFPGGADVARVLALMPRYLNDSLNDRNEDMAPHARMRVRLSFTMGAGEPAATGLTGKAVVAAVRLGNSGVFRRAMSAAPDAQCGVIMDSHLHDEYVGQNFRPDMNPDDYAQTLISDPDKGFEATAWMKLFGYSGQQVADLLP
jgi:hypothetical protein